MFGLLALGHWDCLTPDDVPNSGIEADTILTRNYPSKSAKLELSGNSLLSVGSDEYLGYSGPGTFTQSGGTHSVGDALDFGTEAFSMGTYSFSGGRLSASALYLGCSGTGTLTQSGGTCSTNALYLGYNAGSTGTYTLSGSGLLTMQGEYDSVSVGCSSTGAFTQSGGISNINGYGAILTLGAGAGSSGTYNLSGTGKLLAYDESVGASGTGAFTQSGGTNTVSSNFDIASGTSGSGTYSLSGSGQLLAGYEFVGDFGTATFTQSGGVNSTYALELGFISGSRGTYNLNGGLLAISNLTTNVGSAAFTFSGGTLQARGAFSTSMPMTLGTSGGGATFDTAGYALTLSGPLSGPGSLTKVGSRYVDFGRSQHLHWIDHRQWRHPLAHRLVEQQ